MRRSSSGWRRGVGSCWGFKGGGESVGGGGKVFSRELKVRAFAQSCSSGACWRMSSTFDVLLAWCIGRKLIAGCPSCKALHRFHTGCRKYGQGTVISVQ